MYRNLEAELKRYNITRKQLADALGINVATMSNKLTRYDRLKLCEARDAFEGNYFISISMDTSNAILINKVRKSFCNIGLNFNLQENGDELLETHTINPRTQARRKPCL
jgi:transcriptional regulator with XRE-family HTH domain